MAQQEMGPYYNTENLLLSRKTEAPSGVDISPEEDFNQTLEKITTLSKTNLEKTKKTTQTFLGKMESLYEKNGFEMPDSIKKDLQEILETYTESINEAKKVYKKAVDQFNEQKQEIAELRQKLEAEKALNGDSGKARRLEARLQRKEEKQKEKREKAFETHTKLKNNIKASQEKLNSFAQKVLHVEVGTEKDTPVIEEVPITIKKSSNKKTEKLFEPEVEVEESLPEDQKTQTLIDQVTTERKLEESLSPGLLHLRKTGQAKLAELKRDATLAEKLGVTTFDNTPGGNIRKGGLQGIVKLQKTIGSVPDGILGNKTELALANYEKEINAPQETKESVLEQHPTWKKAKDWNKNWQFEISDINELPNKESFPNNGESCFLFHDTNGEEYRFFNNDRVGITKQNKIMNKTDVLASLGEGGTENQTASSTKMIEIADTKLQYPSTIDIQPIGDTTFMITGKDGVKAKYAIENGTLYYNGKYGLANSADYVLEGNAITLTPERTKELYQNIAKEKIGLHPDNFEKIKDIPRGQIKEAVTAGFGSQKYADLIGNNFTWGRPRANFYNWLSHDGSEFLNGKFDTLNNYVSSLV